MMDMMGAMGWWMLLWGMLGVALIVLVVIVVVRLVRDGAGRRELEAGPSEEVLRQRYAAGEITHDEYLERLNILRGSER